MQSVVLHAGPPLGAIGKQPLTTTRMLYAHLLFEEYPLNQPGHLYFLLVFNLLGRGWGETKEKEKAAMLMEIIDIDISIKPNGPL